jgi:hypothetical protein
MCENVIAMPPCARACAKWFQVSNLVFVRREVMIVIKTITRPSLVWRRIKSEYNRTSEPGIKCE